MFLLYHFVLTLWTLVTELISRFWWRTMVESENGSLKRKEEWSSHHNARLKKRKIIFSALHSPSRFLISISFSLWLRSQICCLFPRGEAARAESPSVSQPRHPSTLNPSSPPHPLTLSPSLSLSLSPGSWSVTTCQMPVSLPHTSFVSVQLSNEILSELQMSEKDWNVKKVHFHLWVRSTLSFALFVLFSRKLHVLERLFESLTERKWISYQFLLTVSIFRQL